MLQFSAFLSLHGGYIFILNALRQNIIVIVKTRFNNESTFKALLLTINTMHINHTYCTYLDQHNYQHI